MDEKPSDHGRPWSLQDGAALKELAARKVQAGIIAIDLGPTEGAVRGKVAELHMELVA
jgi:hypothetical protein